MGGFCAVFQLADPGKHNNLFFGKAESNRRRAFRGGIPLAGGIDDIIASRLNIPFRESGLQRISGIIGQIESFQGNGLGGGIVKFNVILVGDGIPFRGAGVDGADFVDAQRKNRIGVKTVFILPENKKEQNQKKTRCKKTGP